MVGMVADRLRFVMLKWHAMSSPDTTAVQPLVSPSVLTMGPCFAESESGAPAPVRVALPTDIVASITDRDLPPPPMQPGVLRHRIGSTSFADADPAPDADVPSTDTTAKNERRSQRAPQFGGVLVVLVVGANR